MYTTLHLTLYLIEKKNTNTELFLHDLSETYNITIY